MPTDEERERKVLFLITTSEARPELGPGIKLPSNSHSMEVISIFLGSICFVNRILKVGGGGVALGVSWQKSTSA